MLKICLKSTFSPIHSSYTLSKLTFSPVREEGLENCLNSKIFAPDLWNRWRRRVSTARNAFFILEPIAFGSCLYKPSHRLKCDCLLCVLMVGNSGLAERHSRRTKWRTTSSRIDFLNANISCMMDYCLWRTLLGCGRMHRPYIVQSSTTIRRFFAKEKA